MKKQDKKYLVHLYKLVTSAVILSFVAGVAQSIYWLVLLYGNGVEYSQFTLISLISTLLPLVFFGVIYQFLKGEKWYRLYLTSLVTLATLAITWAIKNLTYLSMANFWVWDNFEVWTLVAELIPIVIGASLLGFILYRVARESKKVTDERLIRRYVVVAAVWWFAVSFGQDVYYAVQQYPNNPNLSSFASSFIAALVLLGISLCVWVRERGRQILDRSFMVVVVDTVLFLAIITVAAVSYMLIGNASMPSVLIMSLEITAGVVGVGLLFVYLLRLVRRLP